jgi:hypothetical protein
MKIFFIAGHWWLTPIQEAEITRIEVQSQTQANSKTLSQKYPTQAGCVAQVVEHLLNKCEALSSRGLKKLFFLNN